MPLPEERASLKASGGAKTAEDKADCEAAKCHSDRHPGRFEHIIAPAVRAEAHELKIIHIVPCARPISRTSDPGWSGRVVIYEFRFTFGPH